MRNIVIVDTNFLINNIGNIKEIIKELTDKDIDVYVPEIVKEEFINIQLRKLEETYNKLENLKNSQKIVDLKYRKKEDARKMVEDTYNKIFENNFKDKIITYKREEMLNRVLQRNRYKQPPFYNESNSSDKGFKDTIILLTILDFINDFEDEAIFYFITSDNGFIKYKKEIEQEIFEKSIKNITILDGKDKNKLYKELNIAENQQIQQDEQENIFSKKEIDIIETRKRINDLMDIFTWATSFDFYGNEQEVRRFDISNYINSDDTEKFLNNIDDVIENNIFRNKISVEAFFETEDWVFSKYSIDIDTMKEISELYKSIKDTKYKEAFIKYVSQRINENKVTNMFTTESDDDLPF